MNTNQDVIVTALSRGLRPAIAVRAVALIEPGASSSDAGSGQGIELLVIAERGAAVGVMQQAEVVIEPHARVGAGAEPQSRTDDAPLEGWRLTAEGPGGPTSIVVWFATPSVARDPSLCRGLPSCRTLFDKDGLLKAA